jgi:hypothetical protein
MSGSNFDGEIKDAMKPTSGAKKKTNAGAGKPSPNAAGKMTSSSNSTAKPPPQGMQYKAPQQQAQGQAGLQQATDQMPTHMLQGGPTLPAQSGLQQAHASIVSALAQRDMLKGH